MNLGKDSSKPAVISKSEIFTVHGSLGLGTFCPVIRELQLHWRITYLHLLDNPTILVSFGAIDWTIVKHSLDIGLYKIELRAQLPNSTNISSTAYGYLEVIASKVVARISGGAFLLHGYDRTFITLNASESYDPDVGEGNHTDMSFTWLCKKQNESYGALIFSSVFNLSMVSYTISNESEGLGGCWGTGVGKLNSTSPLIKVQEYFV